MGILFLVPYVPIPRISKRIEIASSVNPVTLVYWDRGTDNNRLFNLSDNVDQTRIFVKSNEGNPVKRILPTVKFSMAALKILKNKNPDCIHVTKIDMILLVNLYCFLYKKNPKIVYEISDIHKMALNQSKDIKSKIIKGLISMIEGICSKRVDSLIVTSELFWEEYYYKWIPKEKVIFLPNTPNPELFQNYKMKKNGKFTIGFIGKIRYKKQIKLLIDASRKIDFNILIAGNGIDLREISEYSSGMENVKIHGAYNYDLEIADLYNSVDCIFSMYDTEIENVKIALPNRLYEASLCKVPIIVSKDTILGDIVNEYGIGVSVEDNNIMDLINKIKMLQSANFSSEIALNCEKFYEENKADVGNLKLMELYNNLLRG